MKELIIESFNIVYSEQLTEQCTYKIDENIFIEPIELPDYFIGEAKLSFYEFYQADAPILNEEDYQLPENFKQIIERFPHTNTEQVYFDGETYHMKKIPVFVSTKNYILAKIFPEKYKDFLSALKKVEKLSPLVIENNNSQFNCKRKELLLDGTYGPRTFLFDDEKHGQAIQDKLEYVNELYSFAHYSYAAMIQFLPQYEINTYDQFHEAYGKYVYSFTLTKDSVTIPLLWPDYLYHKPENHLEFGVLAMDMFKRYALFNHWQEGEQVVVEVLADGFEDVRFEVKMKPALSSPPKLSKNEYILGETLSLNVGQEIIKELQMNKARFELTTPKRTHISNNQFDYQLTNDCIDFSTDQLEGQGRYQMKVISDKYGQLLSLFTVKKKG